MNIKISYFVKKQWFFLFFFLIKNAIKRKITKRNYFVKLGNHLWRGGAPGVPCAPVTGLVQVATKSVVHAHTAASVIIHKHTAHTSLRHFPALLVHKPCFRFLSAVRRAASPPAPCRVTISTARRYNTSSSDQRAHFVLLWSLVQTHTGSSSEAPRKLPGVCPFLIKAPKFPPTACFRVKLFSHRLKKWQPLVWNALVFS